MNCQQTFSMRKKTSVKELNSYQTIVFGGFLYAGSISGVNLLTANMNKLGGKHIIVFAVGCAPERKENLRHVFSKIFLRISGTE